MALFNTTAGLPHLPPTRVGPRPRTPLALPHKQLDQWPPSGLVRRLLMRALSIPHVLPRQSRMSSADSVALTLPDRLAGGPADAFIDGHEFCHLLPLPEGSLHLTLPAPLRGLMVDLGWAEPHPFARSLIMPALLTVYAPRDDDELEVVAGLVSSSCLHAKGRFFECQSFAPGIR